MADQILLLMPGDNAPNPFVVFGTSRKYSCAAGGTVSVPFSDAMGMITSGWVSSTGQTNTSAGTTVQRPVAPTIGQVFNDTTVGAAVVYGGPKTGWLNHATGAKA